MLCIAHHALRMFPHWTYGVFENGRHHDLLREIKITFPWQQTWNERQYRLNVWIQMGRLVGVPEDIAFDQWLSKEELSKTSSVLECKTLYVKALLPNRHLLERLHVQCNCFQELVERSYVSWSSQYVTSHDLAKHPRE